jgi:4,4'-diaponeurosporenoate glycosyltransferase
MGSGFMILIAALLMWPAGFLILSRIRMSASQTQHGRAQRPFSIIIPARNEEHNLPRLLRSISVQSARPLEVIIVDDASTDQTAAVAAQYGATVVASQPLPPGWRGKTWACQQGADTARGDILLFVDADTWFETDGLERILGLYNGGALSVGPYHAVQKPYEQLSAFFNLIMTAGTVPDGLFGQMLLVDRESYRRVGGHEMVKERVLENFHLAERFSAAGSPVRSVAGKGLFAFRMYPNGPAEMIEGWTKGFASGAGHVSKPVLLLIVAWLIGMMLPLGSLLFWPWGDLMYLLFAAQLAFMFRLVGAFRWYTALFYPVPLVFYIFVFTWSVLRSGRQVTWKGRVIRAD